MDSNVHVTAAGASAPSSDWTLPPLLVKDGDGVTLPCVTEDQDGCESLSWIFSSPSQSAAADVMVKSGQRDEETSGRRSLTANCSLVIKNVTAEDDGLYTCRNESQHDDDVRSHLFVVSMREHRTGDVVTLNCTVPTHDWCRHEVRWVHDRRDKDRTPQQRCSASTELPASYLKQKYTCEVTDVHTKRVHLLEFRRPSSGQKPVGYRSETSADSSPNSRSNAVVPTSTPPLVGWRIIYVSLGLMTLIVCVVAVHIWTRVKGNKAEMNDNTGPNEDAEDDGPTTYENTGDSSVH
ncbi:uncharacterized protein LOC114428401 isoform X2 [Parambassis ranga]|uniref:Uncharacterized protein LOC114428401 isoform X2 n=1 Tax=Parambassis ranga TaxID=210632 RepID=A0A6P7HPQ6_9TELE|nr:uncharacterized protein LOC114428401 isoform X2 [Parambassis ranga]